MSNPTEGPSAELVRELQKDAREANKVDRERVEMFEALVKRPEWKVYVELLNSAIQDRADQILAPMTSVDQCVALEGVKGTMRGLIMARDLPSVTIAIVKSQLPPAGDEDETA